MTIPVFYKEFYLASKAFSKNARLLLTVLNQSKKSLSHEQVLERTGLTEKTLNKSVIELQPVSSEDSSFLDSLFLVMFSGDKYVLTELGSLVAANMDAAVRAATLPNK